MGKARETSCGQTELGRGLSFLKQAYLHVYAGVYADVSMHARRHMYVYSKYSNARVHVLCVDRYTHVHIHALFLSSPYCKGQEAKIPQ